MTDEQRKIDRLYEILDKLEKHGDTEDVACMRWAIFNLEEYFREFLDKDN